MPAACCRDRNYCPSHGSDIIVFHEIVGHDFIVSIKAEPPQCHEEKKDRKSQEHTSLSQYFPNS